MTQTPSFSELVELLDHTYTLQDKLKTTMNVDGRLVSLPEQGHATIIGDLHGDIRSLDSIIKDSNLEKRLKNEDQYLICLGDYIDRGPAPLSVFYRLLTLLDKHPNQIILLRGNHEGPYHLRKKGGIPLHEFIINLEATYPREYASALENRFYRLFSTLYTGCIIENQALIVHGGIPAEATTLFDIAWAHRFNKHPENTYYEQILWNDPCTLRGKQYSFRGIGSMFGVDLASLFLEENGLKMLIRGHESYDEGYYFHDDKILTLFSCKLPVYRNKHLAYLSMPLDIDFTKKNLLEHLHQL
jgi:diadenosine tetraphosphatase ApaH/serine/threonine PP2A family protein phosphatase